MKIFLIKGNITSERINTFNDFTIQAMDNDQKWTEDRNDDLLGATTANSDGSFEISFDNALFRDNIFEGKPEIYLLLRDKNGQIMCRTEPIELDTVNQKQDEPIEIPVTINIDLYQSKTTEFEIDLYSNNTNRIISAFSSLGDVSTIDNEDFKRNLRLLNNSINGWSIYAQEYSWNKIGYDGPQVPRYPRRNPDHKHILVWEQKNEQ